MSLLPTVIQPPSDPIGTVDESGNVIPEKNFWLFLYNISKNVLGTPGTPGTPTGTAATTMDLVLLLDSEIAAADTAAVKHQMDSTNVLTWLSM